MIKFKQLPFKMDQVWISSDFHAYHKNIAKGSSNWDKNSGQRDFNNEIEMTETIVNNINQLIKEDDLLIHCGDWSFGGKDNIFLLADAIDCKNIICIEGNHDHHKLEFEIGVLDNIFMEFTQIGYYQVQGVKFMCSHYPCLIYHGQNKKNTYHFYGHVHGKLHFQNSVHSNYLLKNNSIDVGIDNAKQLFNEYRPFKLKELLTIVGENTQISIDHH